MKKKIAAAIRTAAMVLSLAACGGSGSEGKGQSIRGKAERNLIP